MHADQDQIDRDDDVEQARNDQNEDAGDERDDGLQMGDADDHGFPRWLPDDETAKAAGEFHLVRFTPRSWRSPRPRGWRRGFR